MSNGLKVVFVLQPLPVHQISFDLVMTKTLYKLTLLFACAFAVSNAQAQCGSSVTRIWDGGGSDDFFFTAANWSGDVVPDCNDNIVFDVAVAGRSGNKGCRITDSFITSGSITIRSNYTGRITVSGAGTVIKAQNFNMDGGLLTTTSNVGRFTFASVTIGEQCMLAYGGSSGMDITQSLTLNVAGYISFGAASTVNLNAISMSPYSQLVSPEKGNVNLTGNMQKAKQSTFHHKLSTWNITGNAAQTINASNGSTGANSTAGTISFWNVNLNKTNTSAGANDNWSLVDGTDTIIILNRITVIAGDLIGNASQSGFMFHDTLQLNGEGRDGHTGRLFCGGNKTADIILNDNLAKGSTGITLVVLKEHNGSVLNFHKGSANQVSMPAASINAERGTLVFPDDVTVNIPNRAFTIGANATLTMPAAATVKMDATTMNITGSVIANNSTLEFVGSNPIKTSFGGGNRKAFYNVVFNTGSTGDQVESGSNDTLEVLNDVTIKAGMYTTGTGLPNDNAVLYVHGDMDIQASSAANTYLGGQIFVFGGKGNSQVTCDAYLSSGRIVINKANASDVVTLTSTGNTILFGSGSSSNGQVNIQKGILSFDNKYGIINTPIGATPALLIGADGKLAAPSTDTLRILGGWDIAHRNAIDPRNGTITFGAASNTYIQNGNGVILNNLHIGVGGTKTWNSADTLIVKGDLNLVANSTIRNANLVFEGNLTRTSGTLTLGAVIAGGGKSQTINSNSQDQLLNEGLIVNKSAGTVYAGSNLQLNLLAMRNGNFNTNGKNITVLGANSISGGSSSSFIEGTIRITSSTVWSNNRYFIPVGRGSNYRPVQLHAAHATNDWTINYVPSDTVTDLGTAGTHGFDSISASEYWFINRINNGGSGNNVFVELSTLGKDTSWNDADIRIARWNPNIPAWVDHTPGTTGASNNSIITTLVWTEQNARVFTLAVDNTPAPIAVGHDGISGNELDLVKNTSQGNSQVAAKPAISFNVFPNPVAETLNIALSGADKGSITLSDLSGKVLGVYNANTRSINMNQFAAGVYFATFSNGSQRITQRFIRN